MKALKISYLLPLNSIHRRPPSMRLPPPSANRNNSSKTSSRPPNLLLQAATAVFALGFIDAGYSGDWSRIGVISTPTEDFLKLAAFIVVPFSLFFIFSLSQKHDAD